jgi:uncharacterized RDD family membrane protein YckC
MEDGWWYADDNNRNGPVSTERLQELIREGVVGPRTLVWRPGRLAWKPLIEIAELTQRRPGAPVELKREVLEARREPVFDLAPMPGTGLEPVAVRDLPDWARTEPTRGELQSVVLHMAPAGPWPRFFAQLLDIWTLCIPVGFFLGSVAGRIWPAFALWMSSPSSEAGLGLLMVPLALLAQAVVFGLFGTTLGKLLFGVRVVLPGGGRPTFIQYTGRMLRLYWAGLGLCIPFVTLFTMWRQYAIVKAGRPASYDVARYEVHAVPMGTFRRSVAAFSMVALVVGFGYLQYANSEAKNKYFAGFEWRNPISNKHVDIPRGWVFTQQVNTEGDPVFTFSSHAAGVVTIFAMEEGDEEVSLEQYQHLWVAAVRPQMAIDIRAKPVNVRGRFGLQMRGVMVNNASRLIHTTLVKNGNQVWRIVTVGTNGREPESAATEQLRNVLFDSLPDRPQPAQRIRPPETRSGEAI